MVERTAVVDGPLVEGARSVEQAAGRIREKVVGNAQEKLACSRDYISENPLTSIAIAVGAGALIGFLLGRRSS